MRILAGQFKGREILTPRGADVVRPITGLVKKSLFDILGGRLEDATVADLYCGTGTQGLEALSRGARRCCFADRDRLALNLLRRNIEALGVANQAVIWPGDVTARLAGWMKGLDHPLDVAFVDPPYADARRWSWAAVAEEIFDPLARHLAAEGVVVLRLPGEIEAPPRIGPLALAREKRYGDMTLLFLERAGEGE